MMIGMLGLIVVALFTNIGYYEYMYIKRPKKDMDLIKSYFVLNRIKKRRNKKMISAYTDAEPKPIAGLDETYNAR